jgi:hypothetical protein
MVPLAVKNGLLLFSFMELTFTEIGVFSVFNFFSSLPQLVAKTVSAKKAIVYLVLIYYYFKL